jgi:NADH-quinone oxidoreductase subunit L
LGGAHKLLYNKYYIDELYDAIIVKPLYWLSGIAESVIERLGIDKLVNGFGSAVVAGSRAVRLLQAGNIGFYIFIMVVSVIVLLVAAIMR